MNKKGIVLFALLIPLMTQGVFSQTVTIEEAIKSTASEAGQQLTRGGRIAVLNFSSDWRQLSSFVMDEMNNALVREKTLTVVTRQELELALKELNFQMSGYISDESAISIGKFLGARTVMSGEFVKVGNLNYFRIRIINVETGVLEYSTSIRIKKDRILSALTPPPKPEKSYSYEYNIFQKFGIGLLNITFGIGSFYFEPDKDSSLDVSWGATILGTELLGAGLGVFPIGVLVVGATQDWYWLGYGAAIGFGVGATMGFFRGFFVSKSSYTRAEAFPFEINVVSVSANNDLGVQMTYKLSF